jgi:hypothetical protein
MDITWDMRPGCNGGFVSQLEAICSQKFNYKGVAFMSEGVDGPSMAVLVDV